MTINIRYWLFDAFDSGEKRHPVEVIKELGIVYERSLPQSIADQWQFLGCSNIPNELPKFITVDGAVK